MIFPRLLFPFALVLVLFRLTEPLFVSLGKPPWPYGRPVKGRTK